MENLNLNLAIPPVNSPIHNGPTIDPSSSSSSPIARKRSESYQRAIYQIESASQEVALLKQERKIKVQHLVDKRKSSFEYLKRAHQGDEFWLNCVQLKRCPDLENYASEISNDKIIKYFYLGLSLARLLQSNDGGANLVRGALQLFGEWEYHFAGHATQSVLGIMAKGLEHPFPLRSANTLSSGLLGDVDSNPIGNGAEEGNPVVARLYKCGSDVVYEQLLTPPVPFSLNYFEVFLSLCDILCSMYMDLLDEECYSSPHIFEALIKVDEKVKRHILKITAKDFTKISTNIARSELSHLR